MTLKTTGAAIIFSAALMFTAPAFGRQGDVITRADKAKYGVGVPDPKRRAFDKLGPLRREQGGSGSTPRSISDVYWEGIPSKETEAPAPRVNIV